MQTTFGGSPMVAQDSIPVQLLALVEDAQFAPPGNHPRRGRPRLYCDNLFLKALVVMTVRRLHRVGEFFALPESLPERIGLLGRHLVRTLDPWAITGRAMALDSTALFAKSGVWHRRSQDREAGVVPHSSIDTEAGWTKSGWLRRRHGWVYSWKLHLAVSVGEVWIPLAASLTPANVHDCRMAEPLLEESPEEARFVLGDTHYNTSEVGRACSEGGRFLLASGGRGSYPHTDDGVEVRRIFHKLRSVANENFKAIFDVHGPVSTKGRSDTARFAFGAVFTYQIALLHRYHESHLETNRGLKAFLRAA